MSKQFDMSSIIPRESNRHFPNKFKTQKQQLGQNYFINSYHAQI